MNAPLMQHLSSRLEKQEGEVLNRFVRAISELYGDSIEAIIFYGSCMRTGEYQDAVLDFYVVVDRYQHAYSGVWQALVNKLLPPNVFFIQLEVNACQFQAKYAVVSKTDLMRKTSKRAFHPYFWARFVQPIALVFARDEQTKQWLIKVQMQAVATLMHKTECMLPLQYSSKELWCQILRLTYATELRTESVSRAEAIYVSNAAYYDGITAALHLPSHNQARTKFTAFLCQVRWKGRNWVGKLLSIFRLLKATTTFANGVDYVAWKIQRHTGESVPVSNRLRKYPWIFCWPLLWRLYRSGKIR